MKYIGIPRQSKSKAERIQTAIGVVLMVSLVFICVIGAGSLFSDRAPDTDYSSAPNDTDALLSVNVDDEAPAIDNRSAEDTPSTIQVLQTDATLTEEDADSEVQDIGDEDAPGLTCFEVEEFATYYATGTVNIRSGPGVDYELVGEFSFGDTVSVIAATDNGWKKIADGQYVISDFLSTQIPEQEFVGTYYSTGNINVRSGPGTDFDVTRELPAGSPISVVAITGNGWYRTAVDTYVLAELCTTTPPATPTPAATPTPTPIPIPSGVAEQAALVGLSAEDFEFMARVVRAESNGTYQGQLWVAQVIWNRINSSRWPNNVNGVLTPSQFSVVSSTGVCNTAASDSSRKAVVDAYLNPPIPNNVFYFNNSDTFSHEYYGEQGGNYFYLG